MQVKGCGTGAGKKPDEEAENKLLRGNGNPCYIDSVESLNNVLCELKRLVLLYSDNKDRDLYLIEVLSGISRKLHN